MHKRSDLRAAQNSGIEFIKEGYECLLLADVGTGKTVITWTAVSDLLRKGDILRVLIVAPKRVATDVWVQELDEWEHLSWLKPYVACAAGRPAKKRLEIINDIINKAVVINYECLSWLMQNVEKPPFDTLVLDEVDKMKDRNTTRFEGKKVKKEVVHVGLKDYREYFDTIIGMTGTPASNSLLDLWAQCYIIDGGQCLGRSYNKFQRKHFYPTDWAQKNWQVLPTHEDIIYDAIAPITNRIERYDDIAPVVELPPRYVSMDSDFRKIYKKFERDLLVFLVKEKIEIESPHAAAGYGRLRAMAAGFSYLDDFDHAQDFDDDDGIVDGIDIDELPPMYFKKVAEALASAPVTVTKKPVKQVRQSVWHSHAKYVELVSLVGELQGNQLIIVYHFKEQLYELQRRFGKRLEYIGGGVTDKQASATIKKWNSGELELLAIHPASAGHGLNLQKSSAHHICMLTLPDSAGLYEQVVGRLRRTGNSADSIFIHKILMRDTVDEERLLVVQGKIQNQTDLLNAMKKRCGI